MPRLPRPGDNTFFRTGDTVPAHAHAALRAFGRMRSGSPRSAAAVLAVVAIVLAGCSSSGSDKGSGTAPSAGGALPTLTPGANPGITDTTVTVGQVDELSAPVQGMFQGAKVGVQAYFNYINDQGGVNGRKLVLDAQDTQFNAGTLVAKARQMLGETELPLKTIADRLGYRDVYFFSRQFRKLSGVPPAAYRRSRQG